MRILSITFYIILILAIFSCVTPHRTLLNLEYVEPAPGTVQIGENLFIDKCEVDNLSYLEFLYDAQINTGTEVEISMVERSKVWENISADSLSTTDYIRQQLYGDFPLAGISFEEAKAFSLWRTTKVFYLILLESGIMSPSQNDIAFNIADYYEKKLECNEYIPDLLIPYYDLPSADDWKKYVNLSHDRKSAKSNVIISRNTHKHSNYPTVNVEEGFKHENGLYNIIGNVAEMSNIEGQAFGGSWYHEKPEDLNQVYQYEGPTAWLGFRNVCRYITYAEYKELMSKMN